MNNSTTTASDINVVEIELSRPTFIIYICFGILGVVGNGIVLFVIARVKELRDTTNLLIANQSLIDFTSSLLLMALFVAPLPPLPRNNQLLASFLCGFWYTQYPFWATFPATVINLAILTTERYLAVVKPLRYRFKMKRRNAVLVFLIPWISGFLYMSYLPFLTRVDDFLCFQFLWLSEIMQPVVGICTFVIFFFLPFAAMITMYGHIVVALRRQDAAFSSKLKGGVHQSRDYRNVARRNIIKTMMLLCISYAVCWAPNQILYLFYCLGGYVDFNGLVYYVTVCVGFINMWTNPFIYTLQYRKFQLGLTTAFAWRQKPPGVHHGAVSTGTEIKQISSQEQLSS
ncbi:pyroglutamylated RF-amide peptide receptor-like [Diadema setosum]|uniref:pyroglutamylated RF-amide peptide receptor-like n=1 Tax=Diadema setosum TaxID=31175 RepID=UPI003B3A1D78